MLKIKENYTLRYDPDGIFIAERTAEGLRDLAPITDTAAMAWDGLARGLEREVIVAGIAAEFEGAEPELVARDLDSLVEQLLRLGWAEE